MRLAIWTARRAPVGVGRRHTDGALRGGRPTEHSASTGAVGHEEQKAVRHRQRARRPDRWARRLVPSAPLARSGRWYAAPGEWAARDLQTPTDAPGSLGRRLRSTRQGSLGISPGANSTSGARDFERGVMPMSGDDAFAARPRRGRDAQPGFSTVCSNASRTTVWVTVASLSRMPVVDQTSLSAPRSAPVPVHRRGVPSGRAVITRLGTRPESPPLLAAPERRDLAVPLTALGSGAWFAG